MVAQEPGRVARLVQERLNRGGSHASRVRVLADEVRPGGNGDWWYVPVMYNQDPHNMYLYFEAFAKLEEDL
jgi:hypothetical protein